VKCSTPNLFFSTILNLNRTPSACASSPFSTLGMLPVSPAKDPDVSCIISDAGRCASLIQVVERREMFRGSRDNPEINYSLSNRLGLSYPQTFDIYSALWQTACVFFLFSSTLFSLEPSVLLPLSTLHSFIPASQLIPFFQDSCLIALLTRFFLSIHIADTHRLHQFAILSISPITSHALLYSRHFGCPSVVRCSHRTIPRFTWQRFVSSLGTLLFLRQQQLRQQLLFR
jgi:hypothetical protein